MTQDDTRIEYLDCLRILATMAVITLHVATAKWDSVGIETFQWKTIMFYDSITRWTVPIFVMISGVLFLGGKSKPIETIYKTNILRIVTAFCFWSAIHALNYMCTTGRDIKDGITMFLRGPGHLWFLFMIVGLYMLVPFLKKVIETTSLVKYFLTLSIIFTFTIPYFTIFFSIKYDALGRVLENIVSNLNFHFTLGYVSYFVAGYYLNKEDMSGRIKWFIYILGILGTIATILLTAWISKKTHTPNGTFYANNTINVMLESIAIFVFVKNNYNKFKIKKYLNRIITKLSKYSFGACLAHALVIEALDRVLGINALSFWPVVAIPLVAVITIILSYVVSMILHQIPMLKKYVV